MFPIRSIYTSNSLVIELVSCWDSLHLKGVLILFGFVSLLFERSATMTLDYVSGIMYVSTCDFLLFKIIWDLVLIDFLQVAEYFSLKAFTAPLLF